MDTFVDDFDGAGLDTDVWIPHYLPMWSSRAESAATYDVADSELRLTIPPEQGLWCEGAHDDPPLRVSGVQSGMFSGEVGSTRCFTVKTSPARQPKSSACAIRSG